MKIALNNNGQILIEIILAILIGTMIIGAAASLIVANQKSSQASGQRDAAIFLAQEGIESLKSITENNWHSIFLPPDGAGDKDASKGDGNNYCLKIDGINNKWILTSNQADCEINVNGTIYTRTINVYNTNREDNNDENIISLGGVDDPSTQKIKVKVSYSAGEDIIIEQYLTRWRNEIFIQSDWSGGFGQDSFANPTKYYIDDGNINNSGGTLKLRHW
jgi:type II secretory pathway pseudopilin PulG